MLEAAYTVQEMALSRLPVFGWYRFGCHHPSSRCCVPREGGYRAAVLAVQMKQFRLLFSHRLPVYSSHSVAHLCRVQKSNEEGNVQKKRLRTDLRLALDSDGIKTLSSGSP